MVGVGFGAILIFLVVGLFFGKIDAGTFTTALSSIGAFATIIIAVMVPDKKKGNENP